MGTTMSTPLLASIDIETYVQNTQGLTPKQLSYINHVFAPITPSNVETAFLYLQQTTGLYSSYFDVTALSDIKDVVSLLDSGAKKVFVTKEQLEQLKQLSNIDVDRIVL